LGLFGGKKKDRDSIIADGIAQAESEAAVAGQEKKEDSFSSGNAKLDIEFIRIKAQLESLNEVRKANSERFSRMSEQMGELRGMIMDTNKTMSKIEVSATKAIDLVESVQPEKLMIEIRKQDGKGEALKANIESNEVMMRDIMEELKKIRQQMNFYKGIEQVTKLNDEVKGEIFEIKKVEATIERHADKAESIFLDMEKKFSEFNKIQKLMDDIEKSFHAIQGDFDNMKLQLSNKSDKKDLINLMDKFTEFEKHTGNVMKLLDERSKHMKLELKDTVQKIKALLSRKAGISSLIVDEKLATDVSLPAASGGVSEGEEYLSQLDGIVQKPAQTAASAAQQAQPSQAAKASALEVNEARLGDIIKRRSIVSRALSDEAGNPEKKEEGKQK
jgi:hypothetical protein